MRRKVKDDSCVTVEIAAGRQFNPPSTPWCSLAASSLKFLSFVSNSDLHTQCTSSSWHLWCWALFFWLWKPARLSLLFLLFCIRFSFLWRSESSYSAVPVQWNQTTTQFRSGFEFWPDPVWLNSLSLLLLNSSPHVNVFGSFLFAILPCRDQFWVVPLSFPCFCCLSFPFLVSRSSPMVCFGIEHGGASTGDKNNPRPEEIKHWSVPCSHWPKAKPKNQNQT